MAPSFFATLQRAIRKTGFTRRLEYTILQYDILYYTILYYTINGSGTGTLPVHEGSLGRSGAADPGWLLFSRVELPPDPKGKPPHLWTWHSSLQAGRSVASCGERRSGPGCLKRRPQRRPDVPAYLPAYLPTCLPTCLPACRPTYTDLAHAHMNAYTSQTHTRGYVRTQLLGNRLLACPSSPRCMKAFQNYRFKRHRKISGKIAAVSVAHIQGPELLIMLFHVV